MNSPTKQRLTKARINELLQLRDLWQALNDSIEKQPDEVRNEIADRYRLHTAYAKHFPEDHALARKECGYLL